MTQTIRPNVTVSNAGWSLVGAANAWDCVNDDPDSSDGETTYVSSATASQILELALTDPTAPAVLVDHEVRWRARATDTNCGLRVQLVQGTGLSRVEIAVRTYAPRLSYATESLRVSPDAAALITDYTDLRVILVVTSLKPSASIRVTAIEVNLPDAALTNADVESVTRISGEILVQTPPTPIVSRFSGEVLAAAPIVPRVSRVSGEALAAAPNDLRVTRISGEALADNPNSALARISRISGELLAANPLSTTARVTRASGEVLAANPFDQVARVSRISGEVLSLNPSTDARRVTRISGEVLVERTGSEFVVPIPLPVTAPNIFIANWARAVEVETSWLTDVAPAEKSGAEERSQLASRPRRTVRFTSTAMRGNDLGRILMVAARAAQNRISIPLHPDKKQISSWNGGVLVGDFVGRRFHAGARAVVWRIGTRASAIDPTWVTIVSVSPTTLVVTGINLSPADPGPFRVAPAIDVDVTLDLAAALVSAEIADVEFQLEEVAGPSALPASANGLPAGFQSHDGLPIFDLDEYRDASRGVEAGVLRDGTKFGQGRDQVSVLSGDRPRWYYTVPLGFADRIGYRSAIEFFDSRRGRAEEFIALVPGAVFQFVSVSGTALRVADLGAISDAVEFVESVAVVMRSGVIHFRDVEDADEVASTWEFTLDAALPAIAANDVLRVTVAFRARFQSDTFTETWRPTGEGVDTELGVVGTLTDRPVEFDAAPTTTTSAIPETISDLFAWFDAGAGVYSWQVAASWVASIDHPTVDVGANQPGWLVQRWVDARFSSIAEPLPTPRLDSAIGATSAGGYAKVPGFDKSRATIETCKTNGGGLSRFTPRLAGGLPWDNANGKGLTMVVVGALPMAVIADFRNAAGLSLVYWDVTGLQLFEVPGATNPPKAALYTLTPAAAPGISTILVARWTPNAVCEVIQSGVSKGVGSVAVTAIAAGQIEEANSVVLHGVSSATGVTPVSNPLKAAGLGVATRHAAMLLYRRRLSNSELNTLGVYLRDRYGAPWVTMA